jgi:hypothetical protein
LSEGVRLSSSTFLQLDLADPSLISRRPTVFEQTLLMVKNGSDRSSDSVEPVATDSAARRLKELIVSKEQSGRRWDWRTLGPDQRKVIEAFIGYLRATADASATPATPTIKDGGLEEAIIDAIRKIWPDGNLLGLTKKQIYHEIGEYLFKTIGRRPSRSTLQRAFDELNRRASLSSFEAK